MSDTLLKILDQYGLISGPALCAISMIIIIWAIYNYVMPIKEDTKYLSDILREKEKEKKTMETIHKAMEEKDRREKDSYYRGID